MTREIYNRLRELGYPGTPEDTAGTAISWLSSAELLRIEPHWRFLGADGGFSWSKSWEEFSERQEVSCETWEELLETALEKSLAQAFPQSKKP